MLLKWQDRRHSGPRTYGKGELDKCYYISLCVLKIFAEHGTFSARFGGVSMFLIIKAIFWDEKSVMVIGFNYK